MKVHSSGILGRQKAQLIKGPVKEVQDKPEL